MGGTGSKRSVTRSNLRENLVYTLGATILAQSSSKLLKMIVLMISRSSLIMDGRGSKSRSQGQIFEKSSHSRGHIFGAIFLKHAQNVCFDDVSIKLNQEWDRVRK